MHHEYTNRSTIHLNKNNHFIENEKTPGMANVSLIQTMLANKLVEMAIVPSLNNSTGGTNNLGYLPTLVIYCCILCLCLSYTNLEWLEH